MQAKRKAMPRATRPVSLDWSKLLGFDQVNPQAAKLAETRLAKLGVKVGSKDGIKDPRLARIGVKIGAKPGVKLV